MTLAEAFLATQIVVSDEPFALSVFNTLNARGVPLNAADKIKNELFERAEQSEYLEIKANWDAILDAIPGGSMELFLRQRHLAFENADCPKSQLYRNIRDRELAHSSPKLVTKRWKEDAELLRILTVRTANPHVSGLLERHLRSLHEHLGITYSWTLLLAAGRRFFPNDMEAFRRVSRLTLAICFRILTVEGRDVAELEGVLARAAEELRDGAEPKAIAKRLRQASRDEDFRRSFAEFRPSRSRTQFYALFELEANRSKEAGLTIHPFPQSPSQNIEHILPQNPSKAKNRLAEWAQWRSSSNPLHVSDDHREFINRLGNLAILEGEINRQVSNYDFQAKRSGNYPGGATTFKGVTRKSYADSKMRLVKDLCDQQTYPKWTAKEIKARQQDLAKDAVKTWTLRYE
jgi:hypothetical protein